MYAFLMLGGAIVAEVFATTALKSSNGFERLVPSILAILGYCVSFYLLSQVMKTIPTGVVYALWSGVGIVLISVVGWLWMDQRLDGWALLGLGMIVAGVLVINLMSKTVAH